MEVNLGVPARLDTGPGATHKEYSRIDVTKLIAT